MTQQGGIDREGLRDLVRSLYYDAKRIDNVTLLASKAKENLSHLCGLWAAMGRPKCMVCDMHGSASRQAQWVQRVCPAARKADAYHRQPDLLQNLQAMKRADAQQ